jgi:hypothetical protein
MTCAGLTGVLVAVHSSGAFVLVAIVALCVACIAVPEPLTRWVLVPLGMVRSAWRLHAVVGGATRAFEVRSSRVLPAALALLRNPTEQNAAFIEARFENCLELATTGVASLALVALARGDRDAARDGFEVLAGLAPREAPSSVFELARDFIALDAASRGDFGRVAAVGRLRPHGRTTRLLSLLAPSLVDGGSPSNKSRVLRAWALSAGKGHTRALVDRALLGTLPRPAAAVAPKLDAQAALHAVSAAEVRRSDLVAAVQSLDALRASAEWHASIARRALTLSPGLDARTVSDAVLRDAEEGIAGVVLAARMPVSWLPDGPTAEVVRKRLREERLTRVEVLVKEIERRTKSRNDLPEFDEWRAFGDVRRAIDDATVDAWTAAEYRVVFQVAYYTLTSYAVRLINIRTRRVLARQVCGLLKDLGQKADATDAQALLHKNFQACAADRLPRVRSMEGEILSYTRRMNLARAVVFFSMVASISALVFAIPAIDRSALPAKGVIIAAVVMLLIVALLVPLLVAYRFCEMSMTADGVVVQLTRGRYVALRADVASATSGYGGLLVLHLKRAPAWLPRTVFTCASSREKANEYAERITRGSRGRNP